MVLLVCLYACLLWESQISRAIAWIYLCTLVTQVYFHGMCRPGAAGAYLLCHLLTPPINMPARVKIAPKSIHKIIVWPKNASNWNMLHLLRMTLWTPQTSPGITGCWVSNTYISPASGNLWLPFWVSWTNSNHLEEKQTSWFLSNGSLGHPAGACKYLPAQAACSRLNWEQYLSPSSALNNLNIGVKTGFPTWFHSCPSAVVWDYILVF